MLVNSLKEKSISSNPDPFHFYLRKLNEAFQYKVSPFYNPEHENTIADWAISFSKIPDEEAFIHTVGCEICLLVAAVYPGIVTSDRYELLCKNFIVQVLLDDHTEESWGKYAVNKNIRKAKRYISQLIKAIEGLDKSAKWYNRYWSSLQSKIYGIYPSWTDETLKNYKQILKALSPPQQKRCIETFNYFWKGTLEQLDWTNNSATLTEESYLQYRQFSLDAIHCLFLIEYAKNITLTDKEYHHPVMQQLVMTACMHVLYVNDLFSGLKEYRGDLSTFNHIVGVLVRSGGMSVQQAIDEVCDRIELCEDTFIKTRDAWYAGDEIISAASRSYIDGMQDWMSGLIFWSRRSKRYFGPYFNGSVTGGYLRWTPSGPEYTPDIP
jgi:hypothetical protein